MEVVDPVLFGGKNFVRPMDASPFGFGFRLSEDFFNAVELQLLVHLGHLSTPVFVSCRSMLAKLTIFGTAKWGFFDVSVSNSASVRRVQLFSKLLLSDEKKSLNYRKGLQIQRGVRGAALQIQRGGVSNSAWISFGRCKFSENKSADFVDKICGLRGRVWGRGVAGGNAEFETRLLCHSFGIFNRQQSTLMLLG